MRSLVTVITFCIVIQPFILTPIFSQAPDTAWTRTYHRGGSDDAYFIQQTADDGYIIVGTSRIINNNYVEIWLIKTDQNGDTLWTKVIGDNLGQYAFCVKEDPNGGYIITGEKMINSTYYYAYLVKTDDNGDTLWTYRYGGSQNRSANHVSCTSDGGYILTGWYYVPGNFVDIYLHKVNANGTPGWSKVYGGSGWDEGTYIEETADHGFMVAGVTDRGFGNYDYYLLRTDSAGDTLWTRKYGSDQYEFCRSAQITADGGFMLIGESNYDMSKRMLAIKTDSLGEISWSRHYGPGVSGDYGTSVQQTSDGGYIFGGYTTVLTHLDDFCFLRVDSNGDSLWTTTHGFSNHDRGYCVLQTSDGGYILAGGASMSGSIGGDFYVVKLNAFSSDIRGNTRIPFSFKLDQNYPNPFNPETVIGWLVSSPAQGGDGQAVGSRVQLKVYDLLGKEIATLVDERQEAGYHFINWNAKDLASGIYIYQLATDGYSQTRKMILLR